MARQHLFFSCVKPIFHLATLFARTHKKVGTLPTFSRRIFSPANFNQSLCRILVFASRRANKVAKWKIGFNPIPYHSIPYLLFFAIAVSKNTGTCKDQLNNNNDIY